MREIVNHDSLHPKSSGSLSSKKSVIWAPKKSVIWAQGRCTHSCQLPGLSHAEIALVVCVADCQTRIDLVSTQTAVSLLGRQLYRPLRSQSEAPGRGHHEAVTIDGVGPSHQSSTSSQFLPGSQTHAPTPSPTRAPRGLSTPEFSQSCFIQRDQPLPSPDRAPVLGKLLPTSSYLGIAGPVLQMRKLRPREVAR